jgi:hypothetical protein
MSEKEQPKPVQEAKPVAAPKPKKYRLAKVGQRSLTLNGFAFEITNELLQGTKAHLIIAAIQNWEAEEEGRKVLGTLIVLD